MSNSVLDKAYVNEEPAGIPAHRVVVAGANTGGCKLPAGANEGKILGVATFAQEREGAALGVRKLGIALVEAAEPIAAGAAVNVAGSSGRVKGASETGGVELNLLGFAETPATAAGDLIEVFLAIGLSLRI